MKKMTFAFILALTPTSIFAEEYSLNCHTIQGFYGYIPGEANAFCVEYEKACKIEEYIKILETQKPVHSFLNLAKKLNAQELEKHKTLCLTAAYATTPDLPLKKEAGELVPNPAQGGNVDAPIQVKTMEG